MPMPDLTGIIAIAAIAVAGFLLIQVVEHSARRGANRRMQRVLRVAAELSRREMEQNGAEVVEPNSGVATSGAASEPGAVDEKHRQHPSS